MHAPVTELTQVDPVLKEPRQEEHSERISGDAPTQSTSSWTGWASGLLSVAKDNLTTAKFKEQSAYMWGFVKKDMTEFASTMRADAQYIVQSAVSASESPQVRQLVNQVSQALTMAPDDSAEEIYVTSADGALLSCEERRLASRLHALRLDPATFDTEPESDKQSAYQQFQATFSVDDFKSEISGLLVDCTELRALYTRLVPVLVPYRDFWARYFFRVELARQQEARRAALKHRAEEAVQRQKEDTLQAWDDDEDEADVGGVTPIVRVEDEGQCAAEKSLLNAATTVCVEEDVGSFNASLKEEETCDGLATTTTTTTDATVEAEALCANHQVETSDATTLLTTIVVAADELCPSTSPTNSNTLSSSTASDAIAMTTNLAEDEHSASNACAVRESVRGDLIVIMHATSISDSGTNSSCISTNKAEDEWEEDLDVEVTAEDIELAKEKAHRMATTDQAIMSEEDEWENWE